VERWVEIDIDWFGSPPWDERIGEFVDRIGPLLESASEGRGVCFNIGWLSDLVTEWTGRPDQRLPLRSRRYARWSQLSYEDLRRFLAEVRRRADAAGLANLRLGVLVAGLGQVVAPPDTGAMYDLYSAWYDRHPELYPLDVSSLPGPDLDPRVPLRADDYPYASRPGGIRAGEPFPEFFGDQWGAVAGFLGLDLVHFRDGFLGPLLYTRIGPYGPTASPDPEENRTWTDAVRRLFRAAKEAHPSGLVMAYSSGISGIAEWATGCVDLEAIVADGALDIFVDQTWGGAWQDWWDDLWKGWTFQQAYLLGHGAQIRGGNERRVKDGRPPCRHYKLIETWDGWEPWDTLHDVPGKLAWACWAFSHAAVIGPEGRLAVPEGTYISWMNDWNGRLIGPAEVAWLRRHLDAAERSAAALEAVYGPLLVYDRRGLEAVVERDPASNNSIWLEDYVALLAKWGVPIGAVTRSEWLPEHWPDGAVAGVTADASSRRLLGLGGPLLVAGRADRIDPALLEAAGLSSTGELRAAGYTLGSTTSPDLPAEERLHLPDRVPVRAGPGTWVGYSAPEGPLLAGNDRVLYWQPPDLADPGNPLVPRSQLGALSPYIEAGRALQGRIGDGIRVEAVAPHEPVAVHLWRSGGVVHLLAGNLESRWFGDARFPRRAVVVIPRRRVGLRPGVGYRLVAEEGPQPELRSEPTADELRFELTVPPEGFVLARLVEGP
jgi:hypothetical protein